MKKGGPHLFDLSFDGVGIPKKQQVNSPSVELLKSSFSRHWNSHKAVWVTKYYRCNSTALKLTKNKYVVR